MNGQGPYAKLQLWPGEAWVRQGVTDQLGDFVGMLASLRKPEPTIIAQESWRKLLLVLLVRVKAKSTRSMRSVHELLTDNMLILIWKVLQKALSPSEGDNLANMLTEEVILHRIVNLQDHIERVCSFLEFVDSGEVFRYPSQFPERLGRAYIQHAFECANPWSHLNGVAS